MDVTDPMYRTCFHPFKWKKHIFGGNKFDVLKNQISRNSINIFTISESCLTAGIPESLGVLPHYSVIRLDRVCSTVHGRTHKKGGELARFIKNGMKI